MMDIKQESKAVGSNQDGLGSQRQLGLEGLSLGLRTHDSSPMGKQNGANSPFGMPPDLIPNPVAIAAMLQQGMPAELIKQIAASMAVSAAKTKSQSASLSSALPYPGSRSHHGDRDLAVPLSPPTTSSVDPGLSDYRSRLQSDSPGPSASQSVFPGPPELLSYQVPSSSSRMSPPMAHQKPRLKPPSLPHTDTLSVQTGSEGVDTDPGLISTDLSSRSFHQDSSSSSAVSPASHHSASHSVVSPHSLHGTASPSSAISLGNSAGTPHSFAEASTSSVDNPTSAAASSVFNGMSPAPVGLPSFPGVSTSLAQAQVMAAAALAAQQSGLPGMFPVPPSPADHLAQATTVLPSPMMPMMNTGKGPWK